MKTLLLKSLIVFLMGFVIVACDSDPISIESTVEEDPYDRGNGEKYETNGLLEGSFALEEATIVWDPEVDTKLKECLAPKIIATYFQKEVVKNGEIPEFAINFDRTGAYKMNYIFSLDSVIIDCQEDTSPYVVALPSKQISSFMDVGTYKMIFETTEKSIDQELKQIVLSSSDGRRSTLKVASFKRNKVSGGYIIAFKTKSLSGVKMNVLLSS